VYKRQNQIVQAITAWAIKDALWGISNLMHSFGDSTEPDFIALVPVYNRVLAISLIGWVIAAFTGNPQLAERSKSSLGISIAAVALLYLGIAAANYAGRLFS